MTKVGFREQIYKVKSIVRQEARSKSLEREMRRLLAHRERATDGDAFEVRRAAMRGARVPSPATLPPIARAFGAGEARSARGGVERTVAFVSRPAFAAGHRVVSVARAFPGAQRL